MSYMINPKHDNDKMLPYIQDAEHVMEMLEGDRGIAIWIAELLMKLDDNGLLNKEETNNE